MSVLLSASMLGGCAKESGRKISDGTYTGTADGYGGKLSVEITVEDSKIKDITVTEENETKTVSDAALSQIPEAAVSNQAVNIDASSGATVTSRAICEAVSNALHKAGADPDEWKADEPVSIRNPKKEVSADAVVIGAGTAGLAAALRLEQMGIDTTVIEKDTVAGGAMRYLKSVSQVVPAPAGEEETSYSFYEPYFAEDKAALFLDHLEGTLSWQKKDLGITFEGNAFSSLADEKDILDLYDTSANTVGELLGKEAEVSGARMLYSTAVTGIEENEDGAVVYAKSTDGTFYTVTCTYVIVATGSWDDSGEYIYIGSKANEADGKDIAEQLDMEVCDGQSLVYETGYYADENTAVDLYEYMDKLLKSGALIVNENGERFVDETADRETISHAVSEQEGDSYLLLSTKAYESLRSELLKREDLSNETKDLISSDEGNGMFMYDSTSEDVPEGIVNTLMAYASSQEGLALNDGYEDEFGRHEFKGEFALEDGIVLVRLSSFSIGTAGGIGTDETLRVMYEDGTVSEHLFAVGSVCGDVFAQSSAAGLHTTWAFVSAKAVADEIGAVLAPSQLEKLLAKEQS